MARRYVPTGPKWLRQIFRAQSVRNGGIVRRSVADVKKYASFKDLKSEVKRRGFHLLRTGDQYVILCHKGELRIIC